MVESRVNYESTPPAPTNLSEATTWLLYLGQPLSRRASARRTASSMIWRATTANL